jgi:hypothetical protein
MFRPFWAIVTENFMQEESCTNTGVYHHQKMQLLLIEEVGAINNQYS